MPLTIFKYIRVEKKVRFPSVQCDQLKLRASHSGPVHRPGAMSADHLLTCLLDKEATGFNEQGVPLDTFLSSSSKVLPMAPSALEQAREHAGCRDAQPSGRFLAETCPRRSARRTATVWARETGRSGPLLSLQTRAGRALQRGRPGLHGTVWFSIKTTEHSQILP